MPSTVKPTPSAIAPYDAPIAIADKLSEVTRLAAVSCVLRAWLATGLPLASFSASSALFVPAGSPLADRKSTRLNSSHANISYAVFCLKKKKNDVIQLH